MPTRRVFVVSTVLSWSMLALALEKLLVGQPAAGVSVVPAISFIVEIEDPSAECRFCGKPPAEVGIVLVGFVAKTAQKLRICKDCIGLCNEILELYEPCPAPPRTPNPYRTVCSFCGASDLQVYPVISGPGVNICGPCVGECKRVLVQVT